MSTAAVFGAGDVGAAVLRFLASAPEIDSLWAFDVREEVARGAANDAGAIAAYQGHVPSLHWARVDLREVDAVETAIRRSAPDVIVQTASLQSWWAITQLARPLWRRLEEDARFGPWLPLHLLPALRVMQARAQCAPDVPVVNVAFPDLVNPVLGGMSLAPTVGAGNSDLLHPGLRIAAARRLDVDIDRVSLEWLGHHYHVVYFWQHLDQRETLSPDTWHLRVFLDGDDVTERIDLTSTLAEAGGLLPAGRLIGQRTAASAAKNARLLVHEQGAVTHAPAPEGLVGGFDLRLDRSGVEILWPAGMMPDAARAINERAQLGDGVQQVEAGGRVRFTDASADAMRETLGYDCRTFDPDETEERADELLGRLKALAQDTG